MCGEVWFFFSFACYLAPILSLLAPANISSINEANGRRGEKSIAIQLKVTTKCRERDHKINIANRLPESFDHCKLQFNLVLYVWFSLNQPNNGFFVVQFVYMHFFYWKRQNHSQIERAYIQKRKIRKQRNQREFNALLCNRTNARAIPIMSLLYRSSAC